MYYKSLDQYDLLHMDQDELTLVKILPPKEYPIPYKGLFGNVFLNHFTVCRQSHVALALYKTLLVSLCIAQPLELTTHAAHSRSPTAVTRGASTALLAKLSKVCL
jgi:hypothetical protein